MAKSDLTELIDMARTGCQNSLGELLGMYRNYLYLNASLQIEPELQQKFSPSDMVQATFMQAQKNIGAFVGSQERELIAWLRKILCSQIAMETRRYLTQGRNYKRELEYHQDVNQSSFHWTAALVSPTDSPSRSAIRREQAVILADTLAELPEHYREVLVKRHLQGKRFEEIARELQQTVDGVKSVWRRAIALLRKQLDAGQV